MALFTFYGCWFILGPMLFGFFCYAAFWGIQALHRAWFARGARSVVWVFLALHLLEPLPNAGIVFVLMTKNFNIGLLRNPHVLSSALWATAPIAILLLPGIGLSFTNPTDRSICFGLLWRGALRWLVTLSILFTTFRGLVGLDFLLFGFGCWVLWRCVQWSKDVVSWYAAPETTAFIIPRE